MPGPHFWLTTERLALRRFTRADLDWLAELYSDPDVTRFLGGVKDRSKAEELLNTRSCSTTTSIPDWASG